MSQLDRLNKLPAHLRTFYPSDGPVEAPGWPRSLATECTRIYVGDEFCVARMPSLLELKQFGAAALRMKQGLTLLTPVMTDKQIDDASPLFDHLNENHPGTEIVFNDWGVMTYLRHNCSSLKLAAGRILNKGFKDPRLKPSPPVEDPADTNLEALLNESTFDGPWVRDRLLALDIGRCEQDLLPYQKTHPPGGDALETSIYFPLGYVTSGRICWTASFNQSAGKRFMPIDRCSRPCADYMLELKSTEFAFRIFQSGNTIFFLYPADRLGSLLHTAGNKELRLVYQGFGFETS